MIEYINYPITVIIPTLALPERRDKLLRSIECILSQNGVNALPLIVINGQRYDLELFRILEKRDDIKLIYTGEGHVAKAQTFGVENVRTPYYAFLDDDDVFTKDALAYRLELMEQNPFPDLVVTNIYIDRQGKKYTAIKNMNSLSDNPKHSIFEKAWLWSGNNLFRTATISVDYFKKRGRYMEWTELAIRLAGEKRIVFSNKPTAIYYDTPDSAVYQIQYWEAQANLMASMKNHSYPRKTRFIINKKRTAALNYLSRHASFEGKMGKAWRYHMKCLTSSGGLRYLSYTRKLIWTRHAK